MWNMEVVIVIEKKNVICVGNVFFFCNVDWFDNL